MRSQQRVARAANLRLVGETLPVLVCGQLDNGRWYGRTQGQAADIDGCVLLHGRPDFEAGRIIPVHVKRASTYDLEGEPAAPDEAAAAG
jgi:tRNA A37 methylthiotransferase MiaB